MSCIVIIPERKLSCLQQDSLQLHYRAQLVFLTMLTTHPDEHLYQLVYLFEVFCLRDLEIEKMIGLDFHLIIIDFILVMHY